MAKQTPLYDAHVAAGARLIDFGGWDMPIHYGSQIEEHHAVRRRCGVFDVSHMTVVDLEGERVRELLRRLLANDVAKLGQTGRAIYSCMLNEAGGVIDDLIVYYLADDFYRLVVNAATREKDLAWIAPEAAAFDVTMQERTDLAMLAVQGPEARDRFAGVVAEERRQAISDLKRFACARWNDLFVARTGYTGEDGFEVMVPEADARGLWDSLVDAGAQPAGLGARDTLRLEAGMNLYGQDMDETTTPLESGLSWTVAFEPEDRDFVGRTALEEQSQSGIRRKFVGLILEGRGVLRHGQEVIGGGDVTSGSYSPTLECSIALARVPVETGTEVEVDIRGRPQPARVVKPPFVKDGKAAHG